jgi:hypothetical protein
MRRLIELVSRLTPLRSRPAEPACVRRLSARVGDGAALARLLAELPEAEELRPRLLAPFFARAWDTGRARDLWIVSDGLDVHCYVISGLALQQAAQVRVRWDKRPGSAGEALSVEALADAVAATVGSAVTLME